MSEKTIDTVLAEYNRYAAEIKDNAPLIERYEGQIKDIPLTHLGGIDINVTPQELLARIDENSLENGDNTEKDI